MDWEGLYMKKLLPIHKNHSKRIYHRMMKKSSTLKSSLKRRSKEYEVEFKISLTEIRRLLYKSYGSPCIYCDKILVVSNMACDHIIPLSMGGGSIIKNLHIVCGRCNTRKGPLTDKDYKKLLKSLSYLPEDVVKYVLRKLAKSEVF
jgi:5-methylcytosine-specific restriction endonuclease McrA